MCCFFEVTGDHLDIHILTHSFPTLRSSARPRHRDGPVRVVRRSRLETTLTDLVNIPAPNQPVARFSNPLQRAALQQALNLTPTSSARPPTPFPPARSATYGAPAF